MQLCESLDQLAQGADALILVTEWPHYQALPWERLGFTMRHRLILDGRNFLDHARLESAGFRYVGMGRRVGVLSERADTPTQSGAGDSVAIAETVYSHGVSEVFSQAATISG